MPLPEAKRRTEISAEFLDFTASNMNVQAEMLITQDWKRDMTEQVVIPKKALRQW